MIEQLTKYLKIKAFARKLIDVHPQELQDEDDKHNKKCEYQGTNK